MHLNSYTQFWQFWFCYYFSVSCIMLRRRCTPTSRQSSLKNIIDRKEGSTVFIVYVFVFLLVQKQTARVPQNNFNFLDLKAVLKCQELFPRRPPSSGGVLKSRTLMPWDGFPGTWTKVNWKANIYFNENKFMYVLISIRDAESWDAFYLFKRKSIPQEWSRWRINWRMLIVW